MPEQELYHVPVIIASCHHKDCVTILHAKEVGPNNRVKEMPRVGCDAIGPFLCGLSPTPNPTWTHTHTHMDTDI